MNIAVIFDHGQGNPSYDSMNLTTMYNTISAHIVIIGKPYFNLLSYIHTAVMHVYIRVRNF